MINIISYGKNYSFLKARFTCPHCESVLEADPSDYLITPYEDDVCFKLRCPLCGVNISATKNQVQFFEYLAFDGGGGELIKLPCHSTKIPVRKHSN